MPGPVPSSGAAKRPALYGFLLKNVQPLALPQTLRSIAAELRVFDPAVIGAALAPQPRDVLISLTHREREVLALLTRGLSNSERTQFETRRTACPGGEAMSTTTPRQTAVVTIAIVAALDVARSGGWSKAGRQQRAPKVGG